MPEGSAVQLSSGAAHVPSRSPHRYHGQVVPGELDRLFLHRRNRRPDHRGQVLLAGAAGHGALSFLRPPAPAARQRHAVRLAAGLRHGAELLHRAAAVRRQAVERKAGRGHGRALERDYPGRGRRAAGRLQPGLRIRRAAAAARRPGGDRLGDVRHQHLRHHRHAQVRADVRLALVHHGHDPVDRVRLHHRQFRGGVHHRRQPGQPQLDVRAQRGGPDLHADRPGGRLITSFRNPPIRRSTATGSR